VRVVILGLLQLGFDLGRTLEKLVGRVHCSRSKQWTRRGSKIGCVPIKANNAMALDWALVELL
jgi:hypothetical protein